MEKEITLAEFHEEYIAYREGTLAKSTVLADDLALRKFEKHVGRDRVLPQIKPRHCDTFMARCVQSGLKPASTTNHYRHLHTAFEKAQVWGLIEENPLSKVKPPRIPKMPPKYIPMAEIAEFLAGVDDYDLQLLMTAYFATGRRRCELLNLKWSDINWSKREYHVDVVKTHQSVTLPISQLFYDVLVEQAIFWGHRERVFPRWTNPDSVTHLVKQALIKGGYPDLHLHNLRHSFASYFVESGGNIFTLSKLLTHSNVNTTQIYAHLTQKHLAEEVDRVRLPKKFNQQV